MKHVMNTIVRLIKPYGYDKTILRIDSPISIGDSVTLNNGYYDEKYVAISQENVEICGGNYIKTNMTGQITGDQKEVYYKPGK